MNISHMLSAALFAAIMGAPGVILAQQSSPPTPARTTAAPPAAGAAGYLKLDDMNIVTATGEKIGEVEDAFIDASGQLVALAIEVGGYLGIGDNDVIIQLDQLRLDDNQFVTTLTKEQIEALPKWED